MQRTGVRLPAVTLGGSKPPVLSTRGDLRFFLAFADTAFTHAHTHGHTKFKIKVKTQKLYQYLSLSGHSFGEITFKLTSYICIYISLVYTNGNILWNIVPSLFHFLWLWDGLIINAQEYFYISYLHSTALKGHFMVCLTCHCWWKFRLFYVTVFKTMLGKFYITYIYNVHNYIKHIYIYFLPCQKSVSLRILRDVFDWWETDLTVLRDISKLPSKEILK